MRRSLFNRLDPECSTGLAFYRCRTNHYAGCCSVDPCELPGCPDDRNRVIGEQGSTGGSNQEDGKDGEKGGEEADDGNDEEEERRTFTRTAIPTTIASKASPLQPVPTQEPSTSIITTAEHIVATTEEAHTIQTVPVPTFTFAPDHTPSPDMTSAAGISASTQTSVMGNADKGGLSTAAKGGIFGAVGAVMLIVIVAFFLCGNRGRKLRKSLAARSTSPDDDVPDDKGRLQSFATPPTGTIQESRTNDIFASFGGRYEEPRSQFTRACAYNRSHSMKNHPVSPMSRATMDGPPPPIVQPPRPRTATPDFSRADASTPELQGSPKRAAFAELASPGLPKLVQIPMNRQSMQRYKAYRPDEQLHPLCEGNSANLRGDLSATPDERYQNKYVNSWSRWDSGAGH